MTTHQLAAPEPPERDYLLLAEEWLDAAADQLAAHVHAYGGRDLANITPWPPALIDAATRIAGTYAQLAALHNARAEQVDAQPSSIAPAPDSTDAIHESSAHTKPWREPICSAEHINPGTGKTERCFRPAGHDGRHSNLTSWEDEPAPREDEPSLDHPERPPYTPHRADMPTLSTSDPWGLRVWREGDPEPPWVNLVEDRGGRRWCRSTTDFSWYLRDIAGPYHTWAELVETAGPLTEVRTVEADEMTPSDDEEVVTGD